MEQAEDGLKCLEKIHANKQNPFHLLLIDVMMPNMDGYQTSSMLRLQGNRIPILGATGNVTSQEVEKCKGEKIFFFFFFFFIIFFFF